MIMAFATCLAKKADIFYIFGKTALCGVVGIERKMSVALVRLFCGFLRRLALRILIQSLLVLRGIGIPQTNHILSKQYIKKHTEY